MYVLMLCYEYYYSTFDIRRLHDVRTGAHKVPVGNQTLGTPGEYWLSARERFWLHRCGDTSEPGSLRKPSWVCQGGAGTHKVLGLYQ